MGEALREAVLGSTVEIDTPIGTRVPVKIGTDGSLSGTAGAVTFILGSSSDTGRWWIEQNQLCQRWTTWFHGDKHCLKIVRDGNRIAWERDDGETGTATLYPRPIQAAAAEGPRSQLGGPASATKETSEELPRVPVTPPPTALPPAAIEHRAAAEPAAKPAPTAPSATPSPKRTARAVKPRAETKVAELKRKIAKANVVPLPTFWVNGVAEDDVLNVRKGPSAETDIVGSIPPRGRGVKITGACVELWCPVTYNKVSGWANRIYLMYEVPGDVAAAR